MRNLFLNPESIMGKNKVIIGEEYYRYLKNVLRVKGGSIVDAVISEQLYKLRVETIEKNKIICSIIESVKENNTFPFSIHICQSVLKFKKMDLVVSKLSEMGIESFYPVICERTVPREIPGPSRLERWKRLTIEGGKSSGIFKLMRIEPVLQFSEAVERVSVGNKRLIVLFTPDHKYPHILDVLNNNDLISYTSLILFFGPEGGFTPGEIELVKNVGGRVVNMGWVTLRADTAVIIGTGLIKIILERYYKT